MKFKRTRKSMIVVSAAILLVLTGGAVAFASIPDSGGVIHGCYKTPVPAHGSPLSVIDTNAGGTCASGSTALTWNQTGGVNGGAGEVTARTDVEIPFGHAFGDGISAIANCPSGYRVVGGGYGFSGAIPNQQEFWTPTVDFASTDTNWYINIEQTGTPSTTSGSFTFSVFGYCLPT